MYVKRSPTWSAFSKIGLEDSQVLAGCYQVFDGTGRRNSWCGRPAT